MDPLFDYKMAVIVGLKNDGYSDSAACALAFRRKQLIADAFSAGVPVETMVEQILAGEEDDADDPERTPLQEVNTLIVPED